MGVRVKDPSTSQFKEIYVKALDSLPVGTIVDYDGQASDIPTGWETYGQNQIKKTSETRPLASHTVNAYSESESNAYSCNYINDCNTYSTSETFTGKYWIDGSKIYQKTFYGLNGSNSETTVNISDLGINKVWIANPSYVDINNSGTTSPVSDWEVNGTRCNVYVNANVIEYKTNLSSSKVTITIEYTKTTDTVQSTRSLNTYSGDIEEKKDIAIDDGGEETPIDDENDESNK